MAGVIRQELLSGIREPERFESCEIIFEPPTIRF